MLVRDSVKNTVYFFSKMFSQTSLLKMSGGKPVFPFYHIVSDDTPVHIKHLYPVKSIADFKKDLDYLLRYFRPVDLPELIRLSKEKTGLKGNYFHLSFDDGLREIYDIVYPVLKERGIPATFFLNSSFLDNRELFFRFKASILIEKIMSFSETKRKNFLKNYDIKKSDFKGFLLGKKYDEKTFFDEMALEIGIDFKGYLKKNRPYLTTSQVLEMVDSGFTIGSHSLDHPLYHELSLDNQVSQTLDSVRDIKKKFKLDYTAFSFPFTDYGVGDNFFEEVATDVDIIFGCAGLKKQRFPFHYQRVPMETGRTGKNEIRGEYLYYFLKKLIRYS